MRFDDKSYESPFIVWSLYSIVLMITIFMLIGILNIRYDQYKDLR